MLDKDKIGKFLSARRKEKGYTQKELAQKLFISDKTVSKWECGAGMPDISLLLPLADILDVTVTELLEGQTLEAVDKIAADHVEELVKKALTLSEENAESTRGKKRFHRLVFIGAAAMAFLEMIFLSATVCTFQEGIDSGLFLLETLSLAFGIYFWMIIKEKLPVYYDENQIHVYSDGIFRMNLIGVHFNNSNWPHIVQVGRIWSVCSMLFLPLLYLTLRFFMPKLWSMMGRFLLLIVFLGGLFIPMYVAGKKYE